MDSLPLCVCCGRFWERQQPAWVVTFPLAALVVTVSFYTPVDRHSLTEKLSNILKHTSIENRCLRIWVNHPFSYYNKPNRRIMKYWMVFCVWNVFVSLHWAEILEVYCFAYFIHLSNNIYALHISIDAVGGGQIFSVKTHSFSWQVYKKKNTSRQWVIETGQYNNTKRDGERERADNISLKTNSNLPNMARHWFLFQCYHWT